MVDGVKVSMLCGKEGHRANQVHNEQEVKEAVRRLREKQNTAFRTESDLAYVADMLEEKEGPDSAAHEHDEEGA